jgi:transposase InsO family protein
MYNRYYWPKMSQSIAKYCHACATCKRTKAPRDGKHGYLRPLPMPHGRWTDLSVDFIQDLPASRIDGRVCRNILVIVDRLTKRRHFFATHGRSADETSRCFMEVFKLHGLPLSIVSDRGSNFIAPLWKRICQRLHIKRKLSTSHHPETDGQTERANQSLEIFLRQYVNFTQDDWASWLHVAEFQANDTVNTSIGMTPFFADLGYHPRSGIHPGEELEPKLSREAKAQTIRADEMIAAHSDLVTFLKEQIR